MPPRTISADLIVNVTFSLIMIVIGLAAIYVVVWQTNQVLSRQPRECR